MSNSELIRQQNEEYEKSLLEDMRKDSKEVDVNCNNHKHSKTNNIEKISEHKPLSPRALRAHRIRYFEEKYGTKKKNEQKFLFTSRYRLRSQKDSSLSK